MRCFIFTVCLLSVTQAQAAPPHVATFSRCTLQSGQAIAPCHITYRWYGSPRADMSNVIIVPAWFAGTSQAMGDLLGPSRLLHAPGHAFLVFDAFGNGVSASPSNSVTQPGESFPQFSIADMVAWQYVVVHDVLKINHVAAVVGLSMGGMQALQWATDYPDFMDKVVSIVGSPKVTANDIMAWLLLIPHTDLPASLRRFTDRRYQLNAMATHDIARGEPLARAAERIKAPILMILAARDRLLRPQSSLELAQLKNAKVVMLHGPCGHFAAPICEIGRSRQAISEFLQGGS